MKEIKQSINFDTDSSISGDAVDMIDTTIDPRDYSQSSSSIATNTSSSDTLYTSITPTSDDNIWSNSNIISDSVILPDVSSVLESITPKMSNEGISSERMEMLGDSLLKLATTVEIFKIFPIHHEGFLTEKRMLYISNKNLLDAALSSDIGEYLRIHCLSSGKAKLNDIFKPPGKYI
jgi:dsRNA-specific ribonuclease